MNVVVAIAQYAPAVLNFGACVDKACDIIAEAGQLGVQVLTFPETWIPVYPVRVDMGSFSRWNHAPLFRSQKPVKRIAPKAKQTTGVRKGKAR